MPAGARPIVVDNGSRDGSAAIARAHGALVVVEPARGFGAACWTGLRAATAEVVCFMDCRRLAGSARAGDGCPARCSTATPTSSSARACRQPGAWPVHARVANRLLARELRRRSGAPLTDLGPMRAARRAPLLDLGIADRRFGWPLEMVLRAAAAGWRIDEVAVTYRPRVGRSKVTGTVRGTARAVSDMARVLA